MIILHQYPAAFNLPSLSPFSLKVEFFLKLAKLPYKVHVELNPAKGPKRKMPFIEDSEKTIADSSFIIDYLIKTYDLGHLELKDPVHVAQAHAVKIMIEESFYFILLYSRWVDEDGYKVIKREFTPMFPRIIATPFLSYIRRNLRRQSLAQGVGRHNKEEVYKIGNAQIDALAAILGDREFFFENKLTVVDATCYAFLSTVLKQPIESPLKQNLVRKNKLCEYIYRLDMVLDRVSTDA